MFGEIREYRKRKSLPKVWWALVLTQLLLMAVRLAAIDNRPAWLPWAMAGCGLVLLAMLIWLAIRLRNGRTFVGPDGVTTRGAAIRRHRAWSAVYDIRVHPNRGGAMAPRHSTWAYGTDGRRMPLFYVDDRQCDDLLAEVTAIRAAGAAWRGTPWTTLPETEERIRRRGLRRADRSLAVICMMCSYLLTVPFLLWRLGHGQDGHPLVFLLWEPLAVLVGCLALFRAVESRRPFRASMPR